MANWKLVPVQIRFVTEDPEEPGVSKRFPGIADLYSTVGRTDSFLELSSSVNSSVVAENLREDYGLLIPDHIVQVYCSATDDDASRWHSKDLREGQNYTVWSQDRIAKYLEKFPQPNRQASELPLIEIVLDYHKIKPSVLLKGKGKGKAKVLDLEALD